MTFIPKLIGVEGPDACGKTTFIAEFSKHLKKNDIENVILNIAPEGVLRDQALHNSDLSNIQIAALYRILADSAARDIQAALSRGLTVLLDRTQLSWFIYQGELKGLGKELFHLQSAFPKFPKEDILIVINGPYTVMEQRIRAKADAKDNMEKYLLEEDTVSALDSANQQEDTESNGASRIQRLCDLYADKIAAMWENTLETRKIISLDADTPVFLNVEIAYDQVVSEQLALYDEFIKGDKE